MRKVTMKKLQQQQNKKSQVKCWRQNQQNVGEKKWARNGFNDDIEEFNDFEWSEIENYEQNNK